MSDYLDEAIDADQPAYEATKADLEKLRKVNRTLYKKMPPVTGATVAGLRCINVGPEGIDEPVETGIYCCWSDQPPSGGAVPPASYIQAVVFVCEMEFESEVPDELLEAQALERSESEDESDDEEGTLGDGGGDDGLQAEEDSDAGEPDAEQMVDDGSFHLSRCYGGRLESGETMDEFEAEYQANEAEYHNLGLGGASTDDAAAGGKDILDRQYDLAMKGRKVWPTFYATLEDRTKVINDYIVVRELGK